MTSEEIKEQVSIREVLSGYGVEVKRDGMCCCPVHGERHPSMKVYKDSFNCFACGANGDVFTLVQLMDSCDFKTAFITLGGTYEETTDRQKAVATLSRNQSKKQKQISANVTEQLKAQMIKAFDLIKYSTDTDKPLSDRWCDCQSMLPKLQEWWELWSTGEEIDVLNVYRKCEQFNQRFNTLSGDNA